MQLDFADRNIVVTGGAGALGTAVVGVLLEAGAVCHVPTLSAKEAAGFAHRGHARVRVVEEIDLTSEEGAKKVYAPFGTGGERLWASIHIAGGFDMAAIEEVSREAWLKMINLNATTCFLCCREAVRAMKLHGNGGGQGGGGRIVNIAARPALRHEQGANMVAYAASKAAVAAMTGALAAEVSAAGILVNAVAPSIMDTPANRAAMPKADHDAWPKTEEVAAAIAYLASPANTLTSGSVMPVYGRS